MIHDIEVREDHVRYGRIADGRLRQPGSTDLVMLPSTQDPDTTVAFTTNLDVDNETPSARVKARGQINRYRRRWGIENSYKTIKDFLARTTSNDFVVRFFYFGFAVLVYNMWLLVDLIVQFSLGENRPRKPRVTAKRFLNLARKFLRETD